MTTPTAPTLCRVVYISSAVELMDDSDLHALLQVSRANNHAAGVTGLLLYHDGSFLQVLEGADADVRATLSRIRADRRHSGLITLASSEIEQRAFADWSMAYAPHGSLVKTQQEGFRDLVRHADAGAGSFTGDTRVQTQIRSFLSTFREFELI